MKSDGKGLYGGSSIPVREVKKAIGENDAKQILVIHAMSGCDTTSSLFGIGKGRVWHRLKESYNLSGIINDPNSFHDSVFEAVIKMMALLYGRNSNQSLNRLRYTTFMDMASSGSVAPCPERLPPTENALNNRFCCSS